MHLTPTQVDEFERTGLLLLTDVFSPSEVAILKAQVPVLLRADGPGRILERDPRVVRSVYGSHRGNAVCEQLTRHPRLLLPAMRLLDGAVYVHQFKINLKAAFGGDQWEWHQDYIFWRNEDGMPSDRVLNVAIYLDDVTEFNGPMFVLPGSHHEGVIEMNGDRAGSDMAGADMAGGPADGATTASGPAASAIAAGAPTAARADAKAPGWLSHLTTGLKYALDVDTVRALVSRYGIRATSAPAGSVLLFHPNLVHGSSPNMSPFDRAVAIVTFNSVANVLPSRPDPRPEFLAGRDYRPLVPCADDIWTSVVCS